MHVKDAIKERRSIRKFKEKEIESEKIELLKEALIWAPSAANLQARKFYFVSGKTKEKLNQAFHQEWVKKLPLVIVACGNKKETTEKFGAENADKYNYLDTAASIENFMLQAVELELGTCWIGKIDKQKAKEILEIPEELQVVCGLAVGYPAEKGEKKTRKSIFEEKK